MRGTLLHTAPSRYGLLKTEERVTNDRGSAAQYSGKHESQKQKGPPGHLQYRTNPSGHDGNVVSACG